MSKKISKETVKKKEPLVLKVVGIPHKIRDHGMIFTHIKMKECPACGAKLQKDLRTGITHISHNGSCQFAVFLEYFITGYPGSSKARQVLYDKHKGELLKTYEDLTTRFETIYNRHE
jgi:hypothetical protein